MGTQGYNHGDIGWTQLNTEDPVTATGFYTQLFGWEEKPAPIPDYHVVANGSEMLGGITKHQCEKATAPQWVPYVTVKDLDACIEKLKSLGGSLLGEPGPLPDGGRMAIFKDPQGGVTGLAQYAQGPSA